MTNSIRKILVLCLPAAMLLTGCMKESNETILLPVKNKQIPTTVLSAEEQQMLSRYMPINEGLTPPDITGTYLASPMQLAYASDGYYNDFYDVRWEVEGLDGWNRTTYREQQGSSTGTANDAYLIGSRDLFTMYAIDHVTNETQGWEYDLVMVVSGKRTPAGIADYRYAIIMRNKRDEHGRLMEADSYRVFTDGDGLSSKIQTEQ